MTKKLKAIITTTFVYEPNPEDYAWGFEKLLGSRSATIEEMLKADLEDLDDDASWVTENDNSETSVSIVIVED